MDNEAEVKELSNNTTEKFLFLLKLQHGSNWGSFDCVNGNTSARPLQLMKITTRQKSAWSQFASLLQLMPFLN